MSTPTFSVCHATARPNGWQESFKSCFENADDLWIVEYILSCDERFGEFDVSLVQPHRPSCLRKLRLSEQNPKNSVANWNNAANDAIGRVLILNADDFRFPPHWDTELLKVIPDITADFAIHAGTGIPDQAHEDRLISFIIMSRARYQKQGYALFPEYESMDSDVDFTEHAYRDGVVIEARHLVFEHVHPLWGKAQYDDVYNHQNRPEAYALGSEILQRRRLSDFK